MASGIFLAMVLALIVGLLAHRKNRNPLGWSIFGFLLFFIALLCILVMPFLCPRCRKSLAKKPSQATPCFSCGFPDSVHAVIQKQEQRSSL